MAAKKKKATRKSKKEDNSPDLRTIKVSTIGGGVNEVSVDAKWTVDDLRENLGYNEDATVYGMKRGRQTELDDDELVNGYEMIVFMAEKVSGGC